VHDALKAEMQDIHALSIKRCWTPAQQAAQQAAA
jgi:acid stress-induced BolA-like protein IbaG/YrbA